MQWWIESIWSCGFWAYESYREVKMYSDDDYYEDEYSGYGHTGDPNLDRWGGLQGGWIHHGTLLSGLTMLCLNLSRSSYSTSRIWSRYIPTRRNAVCFIFSFRREMFTKWTICMRLPFQSSLISSSRWEYLKQLFHQYYFFKASPWPEAEDVAPYVNDDPIFLNLYRCHFSSFWSVPYHLFWSVSCLSVM